MRLASKGFLLIPLSGRDRHLSTVLWLALDVRDAEDLVSDSGRTVSFFQHGDRCDSDRLGERRKSVRHAQIVRTGLDRSRNTPTEKIMPPWYRQGAASLDSGAPRPVHFARR